MLAYAPTGGPIFSYGGTRVGGPRFDTLSGRGAAGMIYVLIEDNRLVREGMTAMLNQTTDFLRRLRSQRRSRASARHQAAGHSAGRRTVGR